MTGAVSILTIMAGAVLVAAMVIPRSDAIRLSAQLAGLAAILIYRPSDWSDVAAGIGAGLAIGIVIQLLARLRRARSAGFPAEERELVEYILQVEEPAQQRRLRDLLSWQDVAPGTVLMRQGDVAPPLLYVASGEGRVEHGGRPVGTCGPGEFLGDMSAVSGETASATVHAVSAMRIARFDRAGLFAFARQVPEMRRALDHALNRSLAAKLRRMNAIAATGE